MTCSVLAYYFKNIFCAADCIYVKFWVLQFQYEISVNVKTVKFKHCLAPKVICKEQFYKRNGKFHCIAVTDKHDTTQILLLSPHALYEVMQRYFQVL